MGLLVSGSSAQLPRALNRLPECLPGAGVRVGGSVVYYTIISFDYPETVLVKFRRGCLLQSDTSSGDFASSCRRTLSIGNLQDHTPWVLDWALGVGLGLASHVETDCIIQDHHISESSQTFLSCSFRCICLFQAAQVMLVRDISATVCSVKASVCVTLLCTLLLLEHYYTI